MLLIRAYIELNKHLLERRTNTNHNKLLNWFPDYSKDEITDSIRLLEEKDRFIVYMHFGYSLDEYYPISSGDIYTLERNIKSKIKAILESKQKQKKMTGVIQP